VELRPKVARELPERLAVREPRTQAPL